MNTPMRPGVPLEVHRGYCFLPTEFKQRGEPVNRENTLKRLAHYKESAPYVDAGETLAVSSIGATLVATSAFTVAALSSGNAIKMSDGAKTAVITTAVGVGVLSWILCIASDGKYATAAEVYNAHLHAPAELPTDGDAPAAPKPSPAATPVVREPGDDGDYRSPDSSGEKSPQPVAPETQGSPYSGGARP